MGAYAPTRPRAYVPTLGCHGTRTLASGAIITTPFVQETIARLMNATLAGPVLMSVMLACFFAGAITARFAFRRDARTFWSALRAEAPRRMRRSARRRLERTRK